MALKIFNSCFGFILVCFLFGVKYNNLYFRYCEVEKLRVLKFLEGSELIVFIFFFEK